MTISNLSEDIIKTIQCNLDKMGHISNDPILLPCGHVACRRCILGFKNKEFQCFHVECNKKHCFNTETTLISVKPAELLIKSNLNELFIMIEDDMKNSYEKFNEMNIEDKIDKQFDLIEHEISLRVDSLKSQLDRHEEIFMKRLKDMKLDLKNSIPHTEIKEIKENFEKNLKQSQKSKEIFFKCQDGLIDVKKRIEEFSDIHSTIYFDQCESTIDESLIGKIGSLLTDIPSLKQRIIRNKPKNEIKELNDAVYRMCPLPNSLLCVSFSKANKLGVYAKDFKFLKTIDQIGNLKFNNPRGVACDNSSKIVVCDSYNSRIIMADLDFKLVKTVGKLGSGPYEFNAPYDACFSESHLYVCDCKNFRIQKFNKELEFVQTYMIGYCPFQIRSLNNIICVRDFDDQIYFYDSENFEEKNKNKRKGIISVLNDNFLQLDFKLEEIYLFSSNGELESVSKANYADYKNCDMCIFDDNLVITGNSNQLLII